MDIYVGYELYSAGPDADSGLCCRAFFVVAELEDGARYRKGFLQELSSVMTKTVLITSMFERRRSSSRSIGRIVRS
jgi:hypothetical protein